MNAMSARARRAGMGLTAFGAAAATMVLVAPQASAWVSDISVGGSNQQVGCAYTVTATVAVDRLLSVSFTDNGTAITGSPVTPSLLSNSVTIQWTPTTAGAHTIQATQDFISKSTVVQVAASSAFGSVGCGLNGLFPSLSG
ncbi:MAG: hypothetical protein JWN03_277 [Nocardia sp.]|uniref:hypothetical protein n=1 Tax=Nocardia sp. TaxID=1821 RepID=UPI0026257E5B|nr:hypothetical protein [Nocardia sp.]MCU1640002.1 hypothetical protein [Nocardia sp.]